MFILIRILLTFIHKIIHFTINFIILHIFLNYSIIFSLTLWRYIYGNVIYFNVKINNITVNNYWSKFSSYQIQYLLNLFVLFTRIQIPLKINKLDFSFTPIKIKFPKTKKKEILYIENYGNISTLQYNFFGYSYLPFRSLFLTLLNFFKALLLLLVSYLEYIYMILLYIKLFIEIIIQFIPIDFILITLSNFKKKINFFFIFLIPNIFFNTWLLKIHLFIDFFKSQVLKNNIFLIFFKKLCFLQQKLFFHLYSSFIFFIYIFLLFIFYYWTINYIIYSNINIFKNIFSFLNYIIYWLGQIYIYIVFNFFKIKYFYLIFVFNLQKKIYNLIANKLIKINFKKFFLFQDDESLIKFWHGLKFFFI